MGDGPDRLELESYAKSQSLERIFFHGSTDPKPFYRRAKILALTSDFEGYGMVLVEAQAFGCVPVAFDCFSSIHSIIHNGESGVIIHGFNIGEFEASLTKLMSNPSLLEDLATSALEVPSKFQASDIADIWLESISRAANDI